MNRLSASISTVRSITRPSGILARNECAPAKSGIFARGVAPRSIPSTSMFAQGLALIWTANGPRFRRWRFPGGRFDDAGLCLRGSPPEFRRSASRATEPGSIAPPIPEISLLRIPEDPRPWARSARKSPGRSHGFPGIRPWIEACLHGFLEISPRRGPQRFDRRDLTGFREDRPDHRNGNRDESHE